MGNVREANIWHVDTGTAALTTDKNQKVAYIIFTSSGAGDSLTLRELSTSPNDKILVKNALANDTQIFDFSNKPLVFANGIYVQALSASAVAMLVMTSGGS